MKKSLKIYLLVALMLPLSATYRKKNIEPLNDTETIKKFTSLLYMINNFYVELN